MLLRWESERKLVHGLAKSSFDLGLFRLSGPACGWPRRGLTRCCLVLCYLLLVVGVVVGIDKTIAVDIDNIYDFTMDITNRFRNPVCFETSPCHLLLLDSERTGHFAFAAPGICCSMDLFLILHMSLEGMHAAIGL